MSSIIKDFVSSNIPLIWVYTQEEDRFLSDESSALLGKKIINRLYIYDSSDTVIDIETGEREKDPQIIDVSNDGGAAYAVDIFSANADMPYRECDVDESNVWTITQAKLFPEKSLMIMFDVAFYMTDANKTKHTNAYLTRKIKNALPKLLMQNKGIVIVNHHKDIPIELENIVTYVEHKLPDVGRMKSLVRSSQNSMSITGIPSICLSEDETINIAQSLTGLTQWQAENVLSLANRANSIEYKQNKTQHRNFKTDVIKKEKSRLFSKSGVLKIIESDWGMDQVGGMENLKQWAKDRTLIFNHEAREDGIDLPKGLCVVGPGGTGKSWVAQALGVEWDRSVLRLDIGACMGSLLGESESRLIKALTDAEAQAPCILFVDEFEKLFAGACGGGNLDGGTFQRMYGTWLTWTQSRKSDVFVVATTNSITNIPAPALRKGRFDEVMYVGLPGLKQRKEIFSIHLKKRGWDPSEYNIDIDKLALNTPNRTGSEIEQIVIEGLIKKVKRVGFGKENPITTSLLMESINDVKIMAELNPEESKNLLDWAKSHKVLMANKEDDDSISNKITGVNPTVFNRMSGVGSSTEQRKIELNEDDI
jgi:SpoVK/Ycf46/Vps4 family AAA+-type ATPase